MNPSGHHGCRQVMRACDDICDNLCFRRIGYRRFQDADNGGRTLAEPDSFADQGRIAIELCRPETIGQHRRAGSIRAIVTGIEETAKYRMQPHHLEIIPTDYTRTNLARLTETDHRKPDGGEVAEGAQRFDAFTQVLDFRHREGYVVGADAVRTLADVDQTVLVAIDKRPQQYAADHAEYGGVGADPERQC